VARQEVEISHYPMLGCAPSRAGPPSPPTDRQNLARPTNVTRGVQLAVLVTGLALLAACGGAGSEAGPRATASTIASNPPESSPSISLSPTASSSPAASSAIRLNCQLAVYQVGRQKTGFIHFPSGNFVEDPAGAMVAVPPPTDRGAIALRRTVKEPQLQGPGGPFYSWSAARWLPVEREAVSPDGLRYTYAEPYWSTASYPSGSRVHVVNVATGLDRVIYDVAPYTVIDFASEGIYVQQWSTTGIRSGLCCSTPLEVSPSKSFRAIRSLGQSSKPERPGVKT
jgi:hypothetical protein